jgi:hypothetical protein
MDRSKVGWRATARGIAAAIFDLRVDSMPGSTGRGTEKQETVEGDDRNPEVIVVVRKVNAPEPNRSQQR